MPSNFSQKSNGNEYSPYTPRVYEKVKLKKLIMLAGAMLVAVMVIAFVAHLMRPESQQSKYIKSATAAARKQTPNAKVTKVKVAGGFAMAFVSDPSVSGQANAGNTTVFKVNNDGTMKQIANGSYLGPLDLLQLGMPLATQATLTGSNIGQIRQTLADQCGYDGNTPGFNGFDGSFSPNEWQIDSATLNGLEQAVTNAISTRVAEANPGKTVICVNAAQKNSNTKTDPNTYASTYTLEVQFITSDGTLTAHTLTFTVGSYHQVSYTLDGQDITTN